MSSRVLGPPAGAKPGRTFDEHTAAIVDRSELLADDTRTKARPTRELFALLRDCREQGGIFEKHERQGATYRTLGHIARRIGMYTDQRAFWMRECEDLHLTQRHAGHIIARLDDREAEGEETT